MVYPDLQIGVGEFSQLSAYLGHLDAAICWRWRARLGGYRELARFSVCFSICSRCRSWWVGPCRWSAEGGEYPGSGRKMKANPLNILDATCPLPEPAAFFAQFLERWQKCRAASSACRGLRWTALLHLLLVLFEHWWCHSEIWRGQLLFRKEFAAPLL